MATAAKEALSLQFPTVRVRFEREGRVIDVEISTSDIHARLVTWAMSTADCICQRCAWKRIELESIAAAFEKLAADPVTADARTHTWAITFKPVPA